MAYTALYTGSDLGSMAIDVAGALLNAIVAQGGTMGVLLVISIVLVLVVDLITGVFGIFSFFRSKR